MVTAFCRFLQDTGQSEGGVTPMAVGAAAWPTHSSLVIHKQTSLCRRKWWVRCETTEVMKWPSFTAKVWWSSCLLMASIWTSQIANGFLDSTGMFKVKIIFNSKICFFSFFFFKHILSQDNRWNKVEFYCAGTKEKSHHSSSLALWEKYRSALFLLNKNIKYQQLSKIVIKKMKKWNEKCKTLTMVMLRLLNTSPGWVCLKM